MAVEWEAPLFCERCGEEYGMSERIALCANTWRAVGGHETSRFEDYCEDCLMATGRMPRTSPRAYIITAPPHAELSATRATPVDSPPVAAVADRKESDNWDLWYRRTYGRPNGYAGWRYRPKIRKTGEAPGVIKRGEPGGCERFDVVDEYIVPGPARIDPTRDVSGDYRTYASPLADLGREWNEALDRSRHTKARMQAVWEAL